MKKLITLLIIWLSVISIGVNAQTYSISGTVKSASGAGVANASVMISNQPYIAACDSLGNYKLVNVAAGNYSIRITAVGYKLFTRQITLTQNLKLNLTLDQDVQQLDDVTVKDANAKTFGVTRLKAVDGTTINAGKKSEVIVLGDVVANKASNNTRQIYSKVAGLNIWENDGAGIQLGIGGRGLNPNRVTNFNTRQNGYDISADALGYPESYYSPPAELVDRIEILRGASSLQYGTQFGGLINFKLNEGAINTF